MINDIGATRDGQGRDETRRARRRATRSRRWAARRSPHFGDVADWNDTQALFDLAVKEFGDVNVVVCNAGFLRDA